MRAVDLACSMSNTRSRDFSTSLQQLLRVYIDEGYPDIKFAARLAGCSVRTLQRRLKQHNLSYSKLVHQVQIEYAKELLADKKLRTIDIALAVGYQDSSNFSRAFRRIVQTDSLTDFIKHVPHCLHSYEISGLACFDEQNSNLRL